MKSYSVVTIGVGDTVGEGVAVGVSVGIIPTIIFIQNGVSFLLLLLIPKSFPEGLLICQLL